MQETNLSAPWYTYQKLLFNLFIADDEVTISELIKDENEDFTLTIETTNNAKYNSLLKLVRPCINFGKITVNTVVSYNPPTDPGYLTIEDIDALFKGNKYFDRTETIDTPLGTSSYAVFQPDVIQFYNDDLSDYCGNYNGLVEDVVKEVFKFSGGIKVCTKSLLEN